MKTFIGALRVISAASSLSVRTVKTKEISLISSSRSSVAAAAF